ncbi:hypothetical protein [Fictibacillus sp. FJAT-27399]|uniref:hypothetical protein n=1 Tax=Fictibacillus sp. FJAT-27399 TaxID=1729689 RepID=UPI0012E33EA7|nr:hypothetical protein [Fictibacillus sp. FJAT-27399]
MSLVPVPAPAKSTLSRAPAPAPSKNTLSRAPAPAPSKNTLSRAPAPAPSKNTLNRAPAPAPAPAKRKRKRRNFKMTSKTLAFQNVIAKFAKRKRRKIAGNLIFLENAFRRSFMYRELIITFDMQIDTHHM